MALEILPLTHSARDRRRFIEVEFRLNRNDPIWVPPLRVDRMAMLDPRRNPFFEHAEVAHFVAVRDGRDAGRIAAVRNRLHEEIHGEAAAFFGFFETEEDPETARGLLDAAASFARERGLSILRGPASYDSNDVFGALVSGFDDPPMILMPYNRPALPPLLEAAGFRKARDLLAWWMTPDGMPDRIRRIAGRVAEREGFSLRPLRKDRFEEEVRIVRDLYNRCWERNWGFVPLTDAEIAARARDLRRIVVPDLVLFAEVAGAPVGFAMSLPDVNHALRPLRSGRLFPLGLFRLLYRLRRVHRLRILTLGLLPEYRNRGLETAMYVRIFDRGQELGFVLGECSWILEDNVAMNRGIEACGGRIARRYRVYERPV
ncbi:MAG: N-acetyltransferase [Planctomycetes bacterium]|jgi:GNAT superfamily N-acetyltransferase|nr:N-acetyltransferase [Planctomycetota bacterium]